MKLIERKMNLFQVDNKYYFAHCISEDYAMGAGIAVQFQKKFHLRNKLIEFTNQVNSIKLVEPIKYPTCIKIERVFNLITKKYYYNKPTYTSLEVALINMEGQIKMNNIKYLAMPKIGCGLDRLQWGKVKEIIKNIFKDDDIEILVCHI